MEVHQKLLHCSKYKVTQSCSCTDETKMCWEQGSGHNRGVVCIFHGVHIKEKVNHVLKALAASGVWGHAPKESLETIKICQFNYF